MASYYQVVFIPPQCTGLKIAAPWEVIQQWESQPYPRATVSLGWVSRMAGFGNSFSCLMCVLCCLPGKARSHGGAFQLPPLAQQDHSAPFRAPGDFQTGEHQFNVGHIS